MARPWLGFLFALAACGDDAATATPDAAQPIPDAPAGLSTTCDGACKTTSITAAMAMTRTLDHGIYGVNRTPAGTLHIEVHKGGAAGCPTMTSPTPDYSLVLGAMPIPTSTAKSSSAGNLLDFKGDLLGGPLGKMATTVMLTPVAYKDGDFIALDIDLAFSPGTATGHIHAVHCASLDDP
ncbi:MAG: hypothetical protein H0T46_14620 [Deltaproteobacteria bacterium]|nr:hypothetical protein [Deltaproteobacteria bacterium]